MTLEFKIKWCFIGLLALSTFNGFCQTDSVAVAQSDSMLDLQQVQFRQLLLKADSAHVADSLEQVKLMADIANLKTTDQKKKVKLQTLLDSLHTVTEMRETSMQRQVNSLRASTPGVPVIIFKDTVFFIYAKLGPYSPSDRATSIAQKMKMLVDKGLYAPEKLTVFRGEESHDVMHGEIIILSITDRDALWLNMKRGNVAEQYRLAILYSIAHHKEQTSLTATLKRIGVMILVLAMLFFGIVYMNKGFSWLNIKLLKQGKQFFKGVKIKNYELFSSEREERVVSWLMKVMKWLTITLVVYLALPIVFSIFPATKGVASTLFGYVLNPLMKFGGEFIRYIPELITIIVIFLITRYFVRFLKFVSLEIERGKLKLPGFYPDWAEPTFNLLRIIIYAFAFIIIFPYLPGSDSPIFRGVSVFFGLLISFGSSSAISNITAGLVITYMRAFKIGDRVKIGDVVGDVIEKTMLVIRVRTIKNENVTIPNSAIMNGNTINYSTSAVDLGLILNSTVTIGYDVPWRTVHELLINAALKTEHIKESPKPFVLQTSLDDFYVSYQVNAYTEQASKSSVIYSQLHSNIQDEFNQAGVEILSPHYRAERDGTAIGIPAEYLPPKNKAQEK